MNPLYLGTRKRRIFAIHEPPAARPKKSRAAVLCYPWGTEYIYSHRSMRQLAARLSSCGFHTLRFDFYGTGDSGGEMTEADLGGWHSDTAVAIQGLREIADVAQVTLIGLRLGATIAAAVAAQQPTECESLVMWDPVLSGRQYLQELQAESSTGSDEKAEFVELKGYPMSARMMREIAEMELGLMLSAPAWRALMLVTTPSRSPDLLRDATAGGGGHSPQVEFLDSPHPWMESVSTAGIVPVRVIHRITEWLA